MSDEIEELKARLEAHKLAISYLLGMCECQAYEMLEQSANQILGNPKAKPQTIAEMDEMLSVCAEVRRGR